jgi:serine/threonine protein kinase
MIEGLKALHDKKIMHRDLKSANIFLVKNKKQCKIGDMNVSKVIKEKVLRTQTGTPYYASPEVWNDKPYSYKSDLWSIGCVIYELCALRPPFKGKDLDELYINVCRGKVERIKNYYSDSLWKMILMLLQVDVNKRVNCDEFLNHPLIIKKIKEMKEKNIEYKDLEDNKSIHDGYLLNTIKFKDLREIKSQLPTRKNYENMNKNDENIKFIKKNQIFESKSNKSLNYEKKLNDLYKNNYYIQLNNNSLKNNNYTSKNANKDDTNKIFNDIKRSQNLEHNYTDILNIINEKSINKYNNFLSQIRNQNNNYQKPNITNNSTHLNNKYNLYEHNFHTELGDAHSGLDRLSFLRNEREKMKMNSRSELGLNYDKIDTEGIIKYNEKILNLQKEKKKIIEKQREKEKQSKTIEEEINCYNKLLDKISKKLETNEPKYDYLNIINSYNNKNKYDYLNNHNDKDVKNKNEKIEDKYNKILNNINNHQIVKNEKDRNIIAMPERNLKIDNSKVNTNQVSSSTRINPDFKTNNNINKNYVVYYNNIKKAKPLLIKKNILFNNVKERSRSKTPSSLNFDKLNSEGNPLIEKIDKNFKYGEKINISSNNIYKGPLNQISTNNISSLEFKNYFDNLHNNIISTENSSSGNYIKRINKRVVTINKKRPKNNYDSNTNISRSRHISTVPTKRNKKKKNIKNKVKNYYYNKNINQ